MRLRNTTRAGMAENGDAGLKPGVYIRR